MASIPRIKNFPLLLFIVLALAAVALVLTFSPGNGQKASASASSAGAGLNFSIGVDTNGDTINDCGTGVPSAVGDGAPDTVAPDVTATSCGDTPGATLAVNVYLMNNGGIEYSGQSSHVFYTGVTSNGRGDAVFTGCVFEATAPENPAYENVGCAVGLPPAPNLTIVGLMAKFSFTCPGSGGGTLTLGHALGETSLTAADLSEQRETGTDMLTVCAAGGGTTPTPTTGPGATDTPTPPPGSTDTPTPTTGPGATDTPTPPTGDTPTPVTPATNTPGMATSTNTPRPPTPTRTRTPTPMNEMGDVNDDGFVTSTDALWVLWLEAGLVEALPAPAKGDLSGDGRTNSLDALFILWAVDGEL